MNRPGLDSLRILDAAEIMVAEGGMQALSIAALAKHFGVRPPSLYKHIDDLQSLRVNLALRGWRQLADIFAELGRKGVEPRQLGRRWWRFAQSNPGIFEASEASSLQDTASVAAARARAVLARRDPSCRAQFVCSKTLQSTRQPTLHSQGVPRTKPLIKKALHPLVRAPSGLRDIRAISS